MYASLTCAQKLTSQLSLPHESNNEKVENKKKLESRKRICSEVSVNSPRGIRGVSPEGEKEGYGGKDWQKRKVLSLE